MAAPTISDFATFLHKDADALDSDVTAQQVLQFAIDGALQIATVGTVPDTGPTEANLPSGSNFVILAAARRAYSSPPSGVTQQTLGPYTYAMPASSGDLFSRREKKTLRRLAGMGGAFSVDPTPATAMASYVEPLDDAAGESVELGYAEGWL